MALKHPTKFTPWKGVSQFLLLSMVASGAAILQVSGVFARPADSSERPAELPRRDRVNGTTGAGTRARPDSTQPTEIFSPIDESAPASGSGSPPRPRTFRGLDEGSTVPLNAPIIPSATPSPSPSPSPLSPQSSSSDCAQPQQPSP